MHRYTPWFLALPLALVMQHPGVSTAMVEVGQEAPAFQLTDTNGNSHQLADYSGKVVVLAFVGYG